MGKYCVELPKETVIKGDLPTFKWQVQLNNVAAVITSDTLRFAVKQNVSDTTYLIGPKTCDKDDSSNGEFSVTLSSSDTLNVIEDGRAEIQWERAGGTILTIARFDFEIIEDIID